MREAIKVERAGLRVERATTPAHIEELSAAFRRDPDLRAAFEGLTPGRQRGYILCFSGAKQSKTRSTRIDRYRRKTLAGNGFHDR